jgi:hypothetical protein
VTRYEMVRGVAGRSHQRCAKDHRVGDRLAVISSIRTVPRASLPTKQGTQGHGDLLRNVGDLGVVRSSPNTRLPRLVLWQGNLKGVLRSFPQYVPSLGPHCQLSKAHKAIQWKRAQEEGVVRSSPNTRLPRLVLWQGNLKGDSVRNGSRGRGPNPTRVGN